MSLDHEGGGDLGQELGFGGEIGRNSVVEHLCKGPLLETVPEPTQSVLCPFLLRNTILTSCLLLPQAHQIAFLCGPLCGRSVHGLPTLAQDGEQDEGLSRFFCHLAL